MTASQEASHCVYLLKDQGKLVRYVGMGKPSRVVGSAKSKGMSYEIAAVNLTARQALEMEARLINILGPANLLNKNIPPWPRGAPMHIPRQAPAMHFTTFRPRRKALGLTQAQLAELMGIGREQVARIERGSASAKAIQLHDLALAGLEARQAANPQPDPA